MERQEQVATREELHPHFGWTLARIVPIAGLAEFGNRLAAVTLERGEKLPDPVFPPAAGASHEWERLRVSLGSRNVPTSSKALVRSADLSRIAWLVVPYIESRLLPGKFHPSFVTYSPSNSATSIATTAGPSTIIVKGMTEDVAKRSIDWLHSTTCRVLALMGGEPLLRPAFVHKVIYYAAKKGF